MTKRAPRYPRNNCKICGKQCKNRHAKTCSLECKHIAQKTMPYRHTGETKRKLSELKTGTTASPEARAKMSAKRKGKKRPPGLMEKLHEHNRNNPNHPGLIKARADLVERNKSMEWTDERRAKVGHASRQKKMSDEAKAKVSAANLGKVTSPETRAKMAEAARRPDVIAKQQAAAKRMAHIKGGTSIERAVRAKLESSGIPFEEQKGIWRYRVDFFLPESNEVIECDGDFWHSRPEAKARDARKDIYLASLGYRVWRFWESDIKSGRAFLHPIFRDRNFVSS